MTRLWLGWKPASRSSRPASSTEVLMQITHSIMQRMLSLLDSERVAAPAVAMRRAVRSEAEAPRLKDTGRADGCTRMPRADGRGVAGLFGVAERRLAE